MKKKHQKTILYNFIYVLSIKKIINLIFYGRIFIFIGFFGVYKFNFPKKTKFDKTQKSQFWDKNGWESPLKAFLEQNLKK